MSGWYGVDFDGTLAEYHGWNDGVLGKPIPKMVERVKKLLDAGKEVRIFTARADTTCRVFSPESKSIASEDFANNEIKKIKAWCMEVFGQELTVTCIKDYQMIELWDDRCKQVVFNTGDFVEDFI